MAPPRADFRQVYAAGKAIAYQPQSEQAVEGYFALTPGGRFDFQRDTTNLTFYREYINASNYAVGVYMAGAGYSREEALKISGFWASWFSSNYNDRERQKGWIEAGWEDATNGVWKASSAP